MTKMKISDETKSEMLHECHIFEFVYYKYTTVYVVDRKELYDLSFMRILLEPYERLRIVLKETVTSFFSTDANFLDSKRQVQLGVLHTLHTYIFILCGPASDEPKSDMGNLNFPLV